MASQLDVVTYQNDETKELETHLVVLDLDENEYKARPNYYSVELKELDQNSPLFKAYLEQKYED